MKKNNPTLKDIFRTAYENYRKGDLKTAETLCYKILSIDPNYLEIKILLASISAKEKNYIRAKQLLNEAIDIEPNNVTILNNLGTTCIELGEPKNAIGYYKKAIQIDPNNVNAHYNLGAICYNLKQLKGAKSHLQKAIELQPDFALPFLVLGNVCADLKEYENAISNYQKAINVNYKLSSAHNNLGLVFRTLNDSKNAISCYKKAIEIKKDHAGAHHNLALALRESGEFDKAIKSHEMAIKYEPENLAHYFYLSDLKKNILDTDLKNKIEKIIRKNNTTKNNIAYGNYLLSKYEQKTKKYEKELNFLIKGHQFYFDSRKTKFEILVKYNFDDMLQVANEVKVDKLDEKNKNEMKPIFIIGVPRCGSTLVEKIIGSGEMPVPMGEETSVLEEFVTTKIMEKKSLNLGKVSEIRNELFNKYKKRGLILDKSNNIFTDKSLNNFFFLKFIKEIYPNAKIINCKRDILSSIMSIFQNPLTELAWSHDLVNIFKYFDNYLRIIKNYNKTDLNFVYELQFEKLVNNPEEESKKLMKFCELPWNKKCLEFYKRKDLISKTASNIQIRSAIYKHSSGRYLPYKKFLNQYGKKYSWFN
jgi:tetratricopeptide (TPR) repeat protein